MFAILNRYGSSSPWNSISLRCAIKFRIAQVKSYTSGNSLTMIPVDGRRSSLNQANFIAARNSWHFLRKKDRDIINVSIGSKKHIVHIVPTDGIGEFPVRYRSEGFPFDSPASQ